VRKGESPEIDCRVLGGREMAHWGPGLPQLAGGMLLGVLMPSSPSPLGWPQHGLPPPSSEPQPLPAPAFSAPLLGPSSSIAGGGAG
jgi:hypothetical protein